MHFKNENDNNKSNTHHAATTSTSSSTSSTDSGVIIIDNRTTFGNRKINSDNQNNISKNINNNISTAQCNGNIKNTNFHRSAVENDTKKDKLESRIRVVDNSTWNEKLDSTSNFSNIKCNGSNDNSNKNNNNKICEHDGCNVNVDVRNINIEKVINISKGLDEGANEPTNSENQQNCFTQSNKTIDCSPTVSIRSTSISIVSIDENAIDSSIIDSDSDREADAEGVHTNYVVKKLGQQTTYAAGSSDVPNISKGLTVISQKITPNDIVAKDVLNGGFATPVIPSDLRGGPISPTTPQIGSIALTNSTDVTFGDKHFYEGPVTIQQILIDRRDKRKAGEEDGHDNPAFANEPGCDTSGTKSSSQSTSIGSPFSFIRRRKAIVIAAIIIILTIMIGFLILKMKSPKSKLQLGDGDDSRMNIPINSTIDSMIDDDEDYSELLLLNRDDWFARPAKNISLSMLDLPVHRVIISHTASDTCMKKDVCAGRLRVIQDFHMDSMDWDDIGYNFLVGGDGNVYTGRGWNYMGAHTKGYNKDSIGISFIGKDNVGGGYVLRTVPRDSWLAEPPRKPLVPLDLPVSNVIVLATQTDLCESQAQCIFRVRTMQTYNLESQQLDDIAYNFLIGSDGNVYVGRGWDKQGAHLKGQNSKSISLAFIGTFKQMQKPNDKQMAVSKLLLEDGVEHGKLSPDYKIYPAKKFDPSSTAVLSTALYESFKDWPHWSET